MKAHIIITTTAMLAAIFLFNTLGKTVMIFVACTTFFAGIYESHTEMEALKE